MGYTNNFTQTIMKKEMFGVLNKTREIKNAQLRLPTHK